MKAIWKAPCSPRATAPKSSRATSISRRTRSAAVLHAVGHPLGLPVEGHRELLHRRGERRAQPRCRVVLPAGQGRREEHRGLRRLLEGRRGPAVDRRTRPTGAGRASSRRARSRTPCRTRRSAASWCATASRWAKAGTTAAARRTPRSRRCATRARAATTPRRDRVRLARTVRSPRPHAALHRRADRGRRGARRDRRARPQPQDRRRRRAAVARAGIAVEVATTGGARADRAFRAGRSRTTGRTSPSRWRCRSTATSRRGPAHSSG